MSDSYIGPIPTINWPAWARRAFMIGQDDERFSRARETAKRYSMDKLVKACQ